MLKATEFQELVDAAITMEDNFKQVQEERRKRAKFEPKKFINTKPNTNLSLKLDSHLEAEDHSRDLGTISTISHARTMDSVDILPRTIGSQRWYSLDVTRKDT
jgi:hypothetical protein